MTKRFCFAYFDANPTDQQIATVAKFDAAIVNVFADGRHRSWLSILRDRNPDILLLAYVQIATEDFTGAVRGEHMRTLHPGAWLSFAYKGRRLADYTSQHWQEGILDASIDVLGALPGSLGNNLNGLFLDNCAVWPDHAGDPKHGARTYDALAGVVSRMLGDVKIANSSEQWPGTNGSLLELTAGEATVADAWRWNVHCQPRPLHRQPEMNMVSIYTADPALAQARWENMAGLTNAWYCAQPDPQHPIWWEFWT
jgi:hypothetical protein